MYEVYIRDLYKEKWPEIEKYCSDRQLQYKMHLDLETDKIMSVYIYTSEIEITGMMIALFHKLKANDFYKITVF